MNQYLYPIISDLEKNKIYFELSKNRSDAISVHIVVPGERIEIDFLETNDIEVSRFKGDEIPVCGLKAVKEIITKYRC